jgi:hypothetical protein
MSGEALPPSREKSIENLYTAVKAGVLSPAVMYL